MSCLHQLCVVNHAIDSKSKLCKNLIKRGETFSINVAVSFIKIQNCLDTSLVANMAGENYDCNRKAGETLTML